MNYSARFPLGRAVIALPVLLFSFAAMPVYAQSTDSAHVSAVDGAVDFQHGDDGTPEAVAADTSLAQGDYVTTHSSRAEIQFDDSVMVRLGPNTQVRLDDLDSEARVLTFSQGTIELRVLRDGASYPEIQTPSVSIDPNQAGAYRVSVLDDGSTQITVRSGRTHVVAGKFDQVLDTGSTLAANGEGDSTQFTTLDQIAGDDFDAWNVDRDRVADAAPPQAAVAQAPQVPQVQPMPAQPSVEQPSSAQLPSYAVPDSSLPSYAVREEVPPPYAAWRYPHPYFGRARFVRGYYGGGYRR
jgi:hypothetical protein